MMWKTDLISYKAMPDYSLVKLPYTGNQVSMIVMLPRESTSAMLAKVSYKLPSLNHI